jgi:hypothetical protein
MKLLTNIHDWFFDLPLIMLITRSTIKYSDLKNASDHVVFVGDCDKCGKCEACCHCKK